MGSHVDASMKPGLTPDHAASRHFKPLLSADGFDASTVKGNHHTSAELYHIRNGRPPILDLHLRGVRPQSLTNGHWGDADQARREEPTRIMTGFRGYHVAC